jgi:glycerol-3-phosphate acyltransferase PlsY
MISSELLAVAVAGTIGYFLGSLPSAVLIGRRAGVDLRAVGDRNPGYWNAKAQLGRRAALPVFVLDLGKGAVAAGCGVLLGDEWWVGYLATGAAMVGHAWPIFAGFRGGRSVLTFAGGMAVLSPVAALVAAAICVVVTVGSGRFATGARVAVFGFPLVQLMFDPATQVAATGVLMTFIGLRFVQAARANRRGAVPATSGPGAARSM